MAILNYSTKIDAWQTVNEIQQILVKHGATHFSIRNECSRPIAVSFTIDFKGQPLNFLLPCKHDGVWRLMQRLSATELSTLKSKKLKADEQQGFNVGWRIVKDWIEAQLALVEVEMVKVEEVFMPYLIINAAGETLAKKIYDDGGLKQLTNGY